MTPYRKVENELVEQPMNKEQPNEKSADYWKVRYDGSEAILEEFSNELLKVVSNLNKAIDRMCSIEGISKKIPEENIKEIKAAQKLLIDFIK